jgi:phage tail-like protein
MKVVTVVKEAFVSPTTRTDPYPAFNFLVEIDGIGKGLFSEVSGLDATIEVIEYRTGEFKENTVRKLPGLSKYSNITLKRGLTSDLSLWQWLLSGIQGNVRRVTVVITLLDESRNPMLIWKLNNAWPCKWEGPAMDGKSSEIAIETLEICHEGLELVGV